MMWPIYVCEPMNELEPPNVKLHHALDFGQALNIENLFSKACWHPYLKILPQNVLTELPYDFSQLLQNFDTKNVTLGYNQWMCSCHAEITSVVRRFSFLYSSCPMSIPILNCAKGISVLCLHTNSTVLRSWMVLPAICKLFFMQPA